MDFISSNARRGLINNIEPYSPLAGKRAGYRRIPIHFRNGSYEEDHLVLYPHNDIKPFGKIVVFGDSYDFLGLRPDILKYELKFARIGGIFTLGCDGINVEISTTGIASHTVVMPVSHYMDAETAIESFYEVAVNMYGFAIADFHTLINGNYYNDISSTQAFINDYFTKNKQ